jgi:hypothetical protein
VGEHAKRKFAQSKYFDRVENIFLGVFGVGTKSVRGEEMYKIAQSIRPYTK